MRTAFLDMLGLPVLTAGLNSMTGAKALALAQQHSTTSSDVDTIVQGRVHGQSEMSTTASQSVMCSDLGVAQTK